MLGHLKEVTMQRQALERSLAQEQQHAAATAHFVRVEMEQCYRANHYDPDLIETACYILAG